MNWYGLQQLVLPKHQKALHKGPVGLHKGQGGPVADMQQDRQYVMIFFKLHQPLILHVLIPLPPPSCLWQNKSYLLNFWLVLGLSHLNK